MATINKFDKYWRGYGEKGLLVEEMQISTAIVEIGLEISQIKEKIILLFHSWAHTQNSTHVYC